MNLSNCPRCGKLFMKTIKDICSACMKAIDAEFDKCYRFLRDNKETTLEALSEATGVSIRQITKFILEGRILISSLPNMTYPCESCGEPIREHQLCNKCRIRISKGVSNALEDERRAEEQKKNDNTMHFNIEQRLKKNRSK